MDVQGINMKNSIKLLRHVTIGVIVSLFGLNTASAATVNSVIIQYEGAPPEIVVLGTDLLDATFTLGGVALPPSCITLNSSTEQHIGFCSEAATAVPGEGSYVLEINSTLEFSVYAEQAIVAPAPPTPPPVSSECACVAGVSANGSGQWLQPPIPDDNFTFCLWDAPLPPPYTQQVWITGSFTYAFNNYTISALWDPDNPTFDPANPGNSTSVCALYNDSTGTYEVAHPVASGQQFDTCFDWMMRNGGPCL
jgi:hypothetical protein